MKLTSPWLEYLKALHPASDAKTVKSVSPWLEYLKGIVK